MPDTSITSEANESKSLPTAIILSFSINMSVLGCLSTSPIASPESGFEVTGGVTTSAAPRKRSMISNGASS